MPERVCAEQSSRARSWRDLGWPSDPAAERIDPLCMFGVNDYCRRQSTEDWTIGEINRVIHARDDLARVLTEPRYIPAERDGPDIQPQTGCDQVDALLHSDGRI